MVSFRFILSLALAPAVALATLHTHPRHPTNAPGCGEVDVFFTGLPAYHPIVKDLGLDPAMVDKALRADAANVIAAGYNLKVALAGPEQDMSILAERMKGTAWHGTGVGFGMRASQREDVTIRYEDVIQLFREEAPRAPIMFNRNATTFSWAVKRRIPLSSDCADSPGKDYGYEEFCDIC